MENKLQSQIQEDTIDLGKLASIVLEHKKEMVTIIAGCTVLAVGFSFILPKEYESTTLVQTRSAGKDIGGAAAVASMLGVGNSVSAPTANYIELMKSRKVLEPIIDKIEWFDEKKKPDSKSFAKKRLDIKTTKGTNLIEVSARGKSPEEAQMISQGVVENFLAMQTENSQQTQSLLVKFLNERIESVKEDSEEAAAKLASFQEKNKIYSPNDQVKLVLEQLNAYDKSISEMQVAQKSAQAQFDVATKMLNEQKVGAAKFNISDNSTVQEIRARIVSKEVELVGLTQKYQDNYPEVVEKRNQLKQLQQSLADEVSSVVNSNAASLNTAQMEVLKTQTLSQAQAEAASASEHAIKEKKKEIEDNLGQLPNAMVEYIKLESDAKVKQQIYVSLVQQCEKDKIKEAMDSMDIQVIDEANLPRDDKPVWPDKRIFAIVGFVFGLMSSIGFIAKKYWKES